MFKLIRKTTPDSSQAAVQHQWAVEFVALNSADDSPAKVFVMQEAVAGNPAGLVGDTFSCVASVQQMNDLPEDAPILGGPFFRVNAVTHYVRSAAAADEFADKVVAAVQDLANNIKAANTLSVAEVVGIAPAGDPAPNLKPSIVLLSPADGATGVAVGANLVATFHEDIQAGTGNVTIRNVTDTVDIVIPIGDAQVSIVGTSLTINPSSDLLSGKDYAVLIDATAIEDLSGNTFVGILDATTWNFTTA